LQDEPSTGLRVRDLIAGREREILAGGVVDAGTVDPLLLEQVDHVSRSVRLSRAKLSSCLARRDASSVAVSWKSFLSWEPRGMG
jgi:hypothetical protein